MTVGFQSINDDGIYQIDENTYVMGVVASGDLSSLSSVATGEGVDCRLLTLTTNVEHPVFGIYLPDSTNFVGGIRKTSLSGSTWTCNIQLWGKIGVSRNLTNAKYFIFGRMPSQGASGLGLEIYDAASKVVFNSNVKQRSIAGGADTVINAAKRYAMIGGGVGWSDHLDVDFITTDVWTFHQWHEGTGFVCKNGGVWSDYATIYDNSGVGSSGGGYDDFYYGVQQAALAIDVTDLTS